MTTGLSGSYAFNGTNLTLQPTEGHWNQRESYGVDGGGHPIYPRSRSFELVWGLISTNDLAQIIGFYNAVSNTGTVVACLPEYGNTQYLFVNYSGVTLNEPSVGAYFERYVMDVRLVLMLVPTN